MVQHTATTGCFVVAVAVVSICSFQAANLAGLVQPDKLEGQNPPVAIWRNLAEDSAPQCLLVMQ